MKAAVGFISRRPLPSWLRHRPIAHRGLHDAARPENSMAAFEAAAASGYPIELDVHKTRDGEAVVFHDDTLDRMTGETGKVKHRTRAELHAVRLLDTEERVPMLAEVFEVIDGRVPILVELKNGSAVGQLEQTVLELLRDYRGEVAVQSFNPMTVAWFRRHAPQCTRGLLASNFKGERLPSYKRFLLRRLLLAPLSRPDYVGYDLAALPYWAPAMARRLGVPLIAWTIRTPTELRRAARLADNYIFETVRP